MGATAPLFVTKTAYALRAAGETFDAAQGSRILVVIQLAGGNDGLNTVVPYADDLYYQARPTLAIPADQVLRVTDQLGLHPGLAPIHGLFGEGRLRLIQSVGYPNPNRSHFRSMEIWESGDPNDAAPQTGWLGRYLDAACSGCDTPAMTLTSPLPQSLWSDHVPVPSLTNLESILQYGAGRTERTRRLDALKSLYAIPLDAPIEEAVRGRGLNALTAAEQLQAYLGQFETIGAYPDAQIGQRLRSVAQLIGGGLGSHIYFVSHGGFDTHSGQSGQHENLLLQLADAIAAFQIDLVAMGRDRDVLVMTFSEFGRRIQENGSRGTDHGAAAPLFLLGPSVGGVTGNSPQLALDSQADVPFGVDFRNVYASVISEWLGADPVPVVGPDHPPLGILPTV